MTSNDTLACYLPTKPNATSLFCKGGANLTVCTSDYYYSTGHNLPCRCLTANTSTNMGRQFYKCSLPEGQSCEFFQWKDGMEGNWNDSYGTGGTNGNTNGGQTLDMHEENRRVFGHRSFRKGQKDVIEKAIQGKDVFVLMPTGYVKYILLSTLSLILC